MRKERETMRGTITICIPILIAIGSACGNGSPQTEVKAPEPAAAVEPAAAPAPAAKPGQAPEAYAVKLETTKGEIVIDVQRKWAPHGADRFHELVKKGYYNDVAFFRVIAGFMAQTGISGDPALNTEWRVKKIPDDPVVESNRRGMVTFATSGPNSRTTQFFINLADNGKLDGMGFSPFGKVRNMTTVDGIHSGYGEGAPRGKGPMQGRVQQEGNEYLKKEFPDLDYIKSAQILEP
jgi:peptidyl-prolyl cis-trans isomerase A (cyclophilin A)